MNLQYKLEIIGLSLLAFSSCVEDEPYEDNIEIEKPTTACNWDLSSLVCKAGDTFSFKGVYSSKKEYTFSHSEVWYNVNRVEEASATAKLAGSGFNYTMSYFSEALVQNQLTFKFDHSLSTWDGEKFELISSVPVSETLTPINWNTPKVWDSSEQNKFTTYFPQAFAEEFENAVDSLIVTDSYYNSLRYLYAIYPFTNERFAEINAKFGTEFPTDIHYSEYDKQAAVTDKLNRWFDGRNPYNPNPGSNYVPSADTVAYYYGKTGVYNIIPKEEAVKDEFGIYRYAADKSIIVYPVYASAPWVFSRYDDDKGAVVSTVIPEYIAAFKALIEPITFQEWIYYDGYALTFKRKYVLETSFRVFELDGNVTSAENKYNITIN